ncbi:hypothetical protein BDQ12DRAFT_727885 [Crucibulum laeve]|uniref:Uncharacterized protein n=1 Tax=Crucibulum laeve TaxID=68775 RepID=A0A5C3LM60_9AGAR|nr:hypothetical protein BDQ12DRAFT_727885 [Crucibulum laeve]
MRNASLEKVLNQAKKRSDKSVNSPARLVQVLVKDGDDVRNLISVVGTLTLVAVAIVPVFAATMGVQTRVGKCEMKNKRTREEVARVITIPSPTFMASVPWLSEDLPNAA